MFLKSARNWSKSAKSCRGPRSDSLLACFDQVRVNTGCEPGLTSKLDQAPATSAAEQLTPPSDSLLHQGHASSPSPKVLLWWLPFMTPSALGFHRDNGEGFRLS